MNRGRARPARRDREQHLDAGVALIAFAGRLVCHRMEQQRSRVALLVLVLGGSACGEDGAGSGAGSGGAAAVTSSTGAAAPTGTGGSPGDGGQGGGESAAMGCDGEASEARVAAATAEAEAVCGWLERCRPGDFTYYYGGDTAFCEGYGRASLAGVLHVDDAAFTACMSERSSFFEDADCSLLLEPPACDGPLGLLGDTEPCDQDLQCVSEVCHRMTGCGVCVPHREEGESCELSGQCAPLACIDGVCAEKLADGERCEEGFQAWGEADAQCAGGDCVITDIEDDAVVGACAQRSVTAPGEGEACATRCDPRSLLVCDEELESCVAAPLPSPGRQGEPCVAHTVQSSFYGNVDVQLCEPGTTCVDDVCVASSPPLGPCDQGQACVLSTCRDGTCQLDPGPNACACL